MAKTLVLGQQGLLVHNQNRREEYEEDQGRVCEEGVEKKEGCGEVADRVEKLAEKTPGG